MKRSRVVVAGMAVVLSLPDGTTSGSTAPNSQGPPPSANTTGVPGSTPESSIEDPIPTSAFEATIAQNVELETLDPRRTTEPNHRNVFFNVFDTLLQRDPVTAEILPGLAELPQQVDDLTWDLTLRDDVTFHDGTRFTSESVVFTIQTLLEFSDPRLLPFFDTLDEAEALGPNRVRVHTVNPDPLLPARLVLLPIVPESAGNDASFAEHPVGSGPYIFESWDRGDRIILKRNDSYWGTPPEVSTLVIRSIPDRATQLAALQTGEVDLIPRLDPEQADQVPGVAVGHGTESFFFRIDTREGQLTADRRVREALNIAIDRNTLAEALYGDYATVADCQFATPAMFGYNPDLAAPDYDPERARELLAEAGASGATVDLVTASGRYLKDREVVQAVAGQFEDIGLRVNVSFVPPEQNGNTLRDVELRHHLQFTGTNSEYFDADKGYQVWFSETASVGRYSNPDVEALIEEQASELDPERREQLLQEIAQKLCDDVAVLNMFYVKDVYGLSDRIDFTPHSDGVIRGSDIHAS